MKTLFLIAVIAFTIGLIASHGADAEEIYFMGALTGGAVAGIMGLSLGGRR